MRAELEFPIDFGAPLPPFPHGLFRKKREIVDVEYEEISSTPLTPGEAPDLDAVLVMRSRAYPDETCRP